MGNDLPDDPKRDPRLTRTIEETAERLGISRGLAYALAKKGELPTIRLGHRLLVPTAALERLLNGA